MTPVCNINSILKFNTCAVCSALSLQTCSTTVNKFQRHSTITKISLQHNVKLSTGQWAVMLCTSTKYAVLRLLLLLLM